MEAGLLQMFGKTDSKLSTLAGLYNKEGVPESVNSQLAVFAGAYQQLKSNNMTATAADEALVLVDANGNVLIQTTLSYGLIIIIEQGPSGIVQNTYIMLSTKVANYTMYIMLKVYDK